MWSFCYPSILGVDEYGFHSETIYLLAGDKPYASDEGYKAGLVGLAKKKKIILIKKRILKYHWHINYYVLNI